MLWLVLSAVVVYLVYLKFVKPLSYWKKRGIAYKRAWPIVGNQAATLLRKRHFVDLVRDLYNEFPDKRYVGVFQFNGPSIMVRDIELIKRITVKDFDHFPDHMQLIDPEIEPIFGKNLVVLKGQKWKHMRSTLSPSFTGSKMKVLFALINECAEQFVAHFLQKEEDLIELEMKNIMTKFTNDVIATCAFGVKCDSLKDEQNEFYQTGQALSKSSFRQIAKVLFQMSLPSVAKALHMGIFPTHITKFFRGIITETIKQREEQNIVRPDMIHLLMEARKGKAPQEEGGDPDTGFATVQEAKPDGEVKPANGELSIDDIVAQAFIFFLAGFETVATLMSFVCHELAENPDLQKRLQNEIDDALLKCDGRLTYDVTVQMRYLDMVISETLRKWPVPQLDRSCVKEYVIEADESHGERSFVVEKGVGIIIPVYGIHMDPKFYPNPNKFDPDRFSDENRNNIDPYTYMPFGAGPRNCIGSRFALLEAKTLVVQLFSKFDVVVIAKTEVPLKLSPKQTAMAPENGFWLGFKRRQLTSL